MRSVTIIGAGVIGLSLATELAERGIETKVYEAKRSVAEGAEKASGIFSATGLQRIGIPYSNSVVNSLNGAVLHAGREELRVRSREVKAYVVDRGKLVENCRRLAQDSGAEVVLGRRIGREELREMAKESENIIIGADGAVSTVASAFNFPKIKEFVLTYKAVYKNALVDDSDMVDLFFSDKVAQRFFGWIVPYSGKMIEIGIGTSDTAKINSRSAFDSFVDGGQLRRRLESASRASGHASIIPLSTRERTVIGNVALVGDAAGQVKATTGGGIIFGVSCAKVLAEAIHRNRLEQYDRMWRKRYEADLKMHRFMHTYYSKLGTKNFGRFIRLSRLFGAEGFFSRYGDMDKPSLMLKRFFLRGLAE